MKLPADALIDKNLNVYTIHKVWDVNGEYTDRNFRRYTLVRKILGTAADYAA